jgi:UPF0042 nucleotide-binding protein
MAEFLIITGMSGAGRSQASDTFEDLGWFVIDNMPVALISKVMELVTSPGSETEKVALVVGRAGNDVGEMSVAMEQLSRRDLRVRVLYLEASDDVLVRRFENTRRRHPVDAESLVDAITLERKMLHRIRERADVVIDTSDLNVHQLRERLVELFNPHTDEHMQISVMSFGFKNGLPLDVDNVFDCRFLPNPHWVDELRPLNGLDDDVRKYVLDQAATGPFLTVIQDFLRLTVPAYVAEGKSYLSIAAGCTGGHHRSVVIAEEIARLLREMGYSVTLNHRDIDR